MLASSDLTVRTYLLLRWRQSPFVELDEEAAAIIHIKVHFLASTIL